jgi:biopolymer transport protein ExbB
MGGTAVGEGATTMLSSGIALALRATFLGLVTAIPSLIAWNYYNRKVESLAVEMAAICDSFLHQIYHAEEEVSQVPLKPAASRGRA